MFRDKCEYSFILQVCVLMVSYRAYNDMLYLCEKYGPLDNLEKYNPEKDISVSGVHIPFTVNQLE